MKDIGGLRKHRNAGDAFYFIGGHPPSKAYCYPQVFCVVYVAGGSKRYTPLQVRQKVRKCWKYPLAVANLAIRPSLPGGHQTDVPRIHRVWRSKGRLGQRWVFSLGRCGSCRSGRKGTLHSFSVTTCVQSASGECRLRSVIE